LLVVVEVADIKLVLILAVVGEQVVLGPELFQLEQVRHSQYQLAVVALLDQGLLLELRDQTQFSLVLPAPEVVAVAALPRAA
jgi:hypothetical protein